MNEVDIHLLTLTYKNHYDKKTMPIEDTISKQRVAIAAWPQADFLPRFVALYHFLPLNTQAEETFNPKQDETPLRMWSS